tara:strand:+ start:1081 stop:1233 length:153 start_codon:yes stop_codon:yes gene_type:complete
LRSISFIQAKIFKKDQLTGKNWFSFFARRQIFLTGKNLILSHFEETKKEA